MPTDNNVRHIELDGGKLQEIKFFYDLLIEYVAKSKYIKSSHWEYDR
jgi:hypothetical protein